MIKCPECGKEISTLVESCPNCGCSKEKFHIEIKNQNESNFEENKNNTDFTKEKKRIRDRVILASIIFAVLAIALIVSQYGKEEDQNNSSKSSLNIDNQQTEKPFKRQETEIQTETENILPEEVIYVDKSEMTSIYTNPDNYIGKYIKLSGQIFGNIEEDDGIIYFQMYSDPENSEGNTIVAVEKSEVRFNSGDYVLTDGMIVGSTSGKNAFGGTVYALSVVAISVEKSDYITVVSPTIKELPLNLYINQFGYVVNIDKIEFSEKETRVYVRLQNNGSSTFSFYDFNMKIVQNGAQYENQYNYDADYQKLQSEILQGVETSGIVTFPAMDPYSNLQLFCEGRSDNWDEDIEPYQFDIYTN